MITERRRFESKLFGLTDYPTDEDRLAIKKFVDEVPVGVFQELSKLLNARGLMLSITTVSEEGGSKI